VIPAENLVAAFQPGPGQLLGVATSAADARVMLEALEAGTAGVLLRTEDPLQASGHIWLLVDTTFLCWLSQLSDFW
jgi:3-dehydroquinate synthase class II